MWLLIVSFAVMCLSVQVGIASMCNTWLLFLFFYAACNVGCVFHLWLLRHFPPTHSLGLCVPDKRWREMTATFLQICQMIIRKEEVLLPLQHFPVVCFNRLTKNKWTLLSVFFFLKSIFGSIWHIHVCCFANFCNLFCAFVPTAQDVLVYLFGDSAVHLNVEGLSSVSVQELGRSVRDALHISESMQDVFAFWLCSPLLGKKVTLDYTHLMLWMPRIPQLLQLTSSHFFSTCHPSELQLKTRHQPYKLCRQWQDLLYRFTEASEEDISQGENSDRFVFTWQ